MQSLFRSLKSLPFLRRRTSSLQAQGVGSLESFQPLYDRKPPWWTRWTYFLVGADLVVTGSACELTWNQWTRWVPLPDDASSKDHPAKTSSTQEQAKEKKEDYVLRPVWQRAPFAGGQLFLGFALAVLILGSRSRIIRRLYIIPPSTTVGAQTVPAAGSTVGSVAQSSKPVGPTDNRRVVMQCVQHSRNRGRVVPLRECTLDRGNDEAELSLRIDNVKGHYWFGLQDAIVSGQKLPIWQARDEIFKSWYGEEMGKKLRSGERWKSGPAANKK